MMTGDDARVAAAIEQISPILSELGPANIGVLLMWLTARWLAGHLVPGDAKGTGKLQRNLFNLHQQQMWKLVDLSRKEFEERARHERAH